MPKTVISVFGSSHCKEQSDLYCEALELGEALAKAGYAVASGGYGGVMEAVSRGAAESGGQVIGVIASSISTNANRWVQQKIIVENWEQRLHKLIALGGGYVTCRGGTGTLVELAVAWEVMNKRFVPRRPLVVLGEFWWPVVKLVAASEDGAGSESLVSLAKSVPVAVEALGKHFSREAR